MAKMKVQYLVLGSGIGGLATGASLKESGEKDFLIVDRCESVPLNLHNGVHYLHSNTFETPFPFELKQIVSTEEVWNPRKDSWKPRSNIPEMVEYSLKVNNTRHPSSIMDPGNRKWDTFVPMSNNMNDLVQGYYDYIGKDHFLFGATLVKIDTEKKIATFSGKFEVKDFSNKGEIRNDTELEIEYEIIVSTVPIDKMYPIVGKKAPYEFKSQPVSITNYKTTNIVPNWLISIYISDTKFPPYRITILNNIMSMETIGKMTTAEEHVVKYHVERYFDYELDTKEEYTWTTGRIFGINKYEREEMVKDFIKDDIYLLGRFGLWNGKLLMDSTIMQAKEIINFFKVPSIAQMQRLLEKLSN